MNKILTNYLDDNFNKDFKWKIAVFYFSCYGAFSYYYLTNEALLKLESESVVKILTILTVGVLFGNITTFPFAFLLRLTAKIFHFQSSYKDLIKSLTIAYKPHLLTILLIICRIIIAPDSKIQLAPDSIGLLVLFLMIINLLIATLGIISLILLFKGLMKVQNLTLGRTVLYYLIASIAFSPVYLLLTRL
jgi:hypothetical protein